MSNYLLAATHVPGAKRKLAAADVVASAEKLSKRAKKKDDEEEAAGKDDEEEAAGQTKSDPKAEEEPMAVEEAANMDVEEYDGDDAREAVMEALDNVMSPGTYAAGGACDRSGLDTLNAPLLHVNGVGKIKLPLVEAQGKTLAATCEQAPFGLGSKTVVDRTVRNTKQLPPSMFRVTNKQWDSTVQALTDEVCVQLGVDSSTTVRAELYKLLLYEKGSFFKPHRDSEKANGMFATLVIALPSAFEGGKLVVRHAGERREFDYASQSGKKSHFMAFYADCEHELRKVTAGHRLCLVYNLCKTGSSKKASSNKNKPNVANIGNDMKQLAMAAAAWGKSFQEDGLKLVFMTDHLYTPDGMRGHTPFSKFKGDDAAMVEFLELAIAAGVDIEWDHGVFSRSESGYALDNGGGYYNYHDECVCEDPDDENACECGAWNEYRSGPHNGGFQWEETTDSQLSLTTDRWGIISFDPETEITDMDFYDRQEPEDESFEPTGNEGVHAERTYSDEHCIVVWPRSQRWIVTTNNDLRKMSKFLLHASESGTEDSESKEECIAKARTVIRKTVSDSGSAYHGRGMAAGNVRDLMRALVQIGDAQLALEVFLRPYISSKASAMPGEILPELSAFLQAFGGSSVGPILLGLMSVERYNASPSNAAEFVIDVWKLLRDISSHTQLVQELAALLVGFMSNDAHDKSLAGALCTFPLENFFAMFRGKWAIGGRSPELTARSLAGIVRASGKERMQKTSRYSSTFSSVKAKGPVELVGVGLVNLFEFLGWEPFAQSLVTSVQLLCSLGSSASAVALVEELGGASLPSSLDSNSPRQKICLKLTTFVCGVMVDQGNPSEKGPSVMQAQSTLFKVVTRFCPSLLSKFVNQLKRFDVDSVVTPVALVAAQTAGIVSGLDGGGDGGGGGGSCNSSSSSSSSGSDDGSTPKTAALELVRHCASILVDRLSAPIKEFQIWTIPGAGELVNGDSRGLSATHLKSFLANPCLEKIEFHCFKKDHPSVNRMLCRLGSQVRGEGFKRCPRGVYEYRITKLRKYSVTTSQKRSLSCQCRARYGGYSIRLNRAPSYRYPMGYGISSSTTSACPVRTHAALLESQAKDQKTLKPLMRLLPPDMRPSAHVVIPSPPSGGGREKKKSKKALQNSRNSSSSSSSGEVIDLTAKKRSKKVLHNSTNSSSFSSFSSTGPSSEVIDLT